MIEQEGATELPGFRPFFPPKHKSKKNNNYRFFISDDESIIYKKNNHSNPSIVDMLQDNEKRSFFSQVLEGNGLGEDLQLHVVRGFDLEGDGSYKSEFIHGFRLDLLHIHELSKEQSHSILEAIEVFIHRIIDQDSKGNLTGDWALHNLVYSLKYGRIVNIDLEGFLFYNPLPEWANLNHILGWIEEVKSKISGRDYESICE